MKVCVAGLWHLGCVTAACLADAGHRVVGWDPDERTVLALKDGKPPVFEPGLEELMREGLGKGSLTFEGRPDKAFSDADVVWVAFDTPVDENDEADVQFVKNQIRLLIKHAPRGSLFVLSSQCPVGTIAELEQMARAECPEKPCRFACSPENLRLGKAIKAFMSPDRIVVGCRTDDDKQVLKDLFAPLSSELLWMSVESAEMSKHAVNSFLALSVAFANEIAELCEYVGADAGDVARAMKTEPRIGPKAYLAPGAAFAGGTLARDVAFLGRMAGGHDLPLFLINSVAESNNRHKTWFDRVVSRKLGPDGVGKTIAVWGLTYKPGTDTLRRSLAVEFCRRSADRGFCVRTHDPAISKLPDDLKKSVRLMSDPLEACRDSDLLVVATEWPEYKRISLENVVALMKKPRVADPNRFLHEIFGNDQRVDYISVGNMK